MGHEEIWAFESEQYPWKFMVNVSLYVHNCFPFELAGLLVAHRFLISTPKYFVNI